MSLAQSPPRWGWKPGPPSCLFERPTATGAPGGRSRELLPVLHSKHGRSTCSINGLWLSEGMDT